MNKLTDQQLLREYAEGRSEAAFTELVRRHIDFVYSAAFRMTDEAHSAQDVTQAVFVTLAQNSARLTRHPILSGWLHTTARNLAAKQVRATVRRQNHEQEAASMNELLSTAPDASWEEIAPHLDAALGELSEPDRNVVLLRYFERKSAVEIARLLGVSDDAAQKRVSRAVERMREFFVKRGVSVGAGGLVVVISANAVQAAPLGLAATISAAALAGTAAATSTVFAATTKTIAMTTLQKTLVTATVAALAGAGIYEARQAAQLRDQVQTLQQQQAPLTEQMSKLQSENEWLSTMVAQASDSQALSKAQFSELLRLRGKSSQAQADSRELAKLKTTLAQQTGKAPDFVSNAMAAGAAAGEKAMQKEALARLTRMKKILNLTDYQEQAINNIMTNRIHHAVQLTLGMLTGKLTPEQAQPLAIASADDDAEIKALLTPEQLAAYPEYQQAEKAIAADTSATSDARKMADKFSLSQAQQEQLRALFYEMMSKEPASALNEQAINQARKSGNMAEAARMSIELEKVRLQQKLKILEGFVSPDQMTTYLQEQTDRINHQADMMKIFLQQQTAEATN